MRLFLVRQAPQSAGTNTIGKWLELQQAPIQQVGTILSHTPSNSAASNMSARDSATAVPMHHIAAERNNPPLVFRDAIATWLARRR
jgi:hypothetical protein